MEFIKFKERRGFSLVEIFIVVSMIILLSAGILLLLQKPKEDAEAIAEYQLLKEIENAILEAHRNGADVVVRDVVLPSNSGGTITGNSRMNRADGMFVSGGAEVEAILGRTIASLPQHLRFGKLSTTITGANGRAAVTKNNLVLWAYGTDDTTALNNYYYSNGVYAGYVKTLKAKNVKTGGGDFSSVVLTSFAWDKWN